MAVFGLDIGSTSIKAVQLDRRGAGFVLLAAGITVTPPSGISSDLDKDLESVAVAVKRLINDAKITAREVNLSIAESQVFTRLVKLPYLTDEEVASAISWQAEPYIPIPVDQASIDYQIVKRVQPSGNTPGSVEVLLVATPKTLVKKYAKVAQMAGLTVVNVESELLALSRALAPAGTTTLIADLGASSSDLGVVKSGQLMVSRSVATGGNVLTRAVSAGLSLGSQQAEEYKRAYGLSDAQLEGKVKATLEPALEVVIDEMKKTLQYYKTEVEREDQVNLLVLTGGAAAMPELTTLLAQTLGLEVVLGDPFARVAKDERTAKSLSSWFPLYGIAVGLAQNI